MGQRQFGQNDIAGPAGIVPTGPIGMPDQIFLKTSSYQPYYSMGIWAPSGGCVYSVSPAIPTANVYSTIYSYTGKGALGHFGIGCTNISARNVRVRITLDGNVILETNYANGVSPTRSNYYVYLGGWVLANPAAYSLYGSDTFMPTFDYMLFEKSILLEITSSVADTGGSYDVGYKVIKR